MLLVRDVEGPEIAGVGESVTYRATAFNLPNPSEADKREINWVIERDSRCRSSAASQSNFIEASNKIAGHKSLPVDESNCSVSTDGLASENSAVLSQAVTVPSSPAVSRKRRPVCEKFQYSRPRVE